MKCKIKKRKKGVAEKEDRKEKKLKKNREKPQTRI